jgi:hypothetical protein
LFHVCIITHYTTELFESESCGFFSNAFGGFFEKKEIGSVSVSKKTLELYLLLRSKSLIANGFTDPQELNFILTKFMEYYLEREIKSEKYLI